MTVPTTKSLQNKPKVLFLGQLDESLPEYQQFENDFECIPYELTTKEQLLEDFKSKFNDIQAIYGGWEGFMSFGGYRNEIVDLSPPNLKIVTSCAVGFDHYDTIQLKNKKIIFSNSPSVGAEQVADLALYQTLSTFRFIPMFANQTVSTKNTLVARSKLNGNFNYQSGNHVPKNHYNFAFGEIAGGKVVYTPMNKNAAILGFGGIGKALAKRLNAIGMNIHYFKRNPLSNDDLSDFNFPLTYHNSLTSILPIADVVIICLPGSSETFNLINEKTINLLPKRGSRIVNVGRGFIVNTKDLLNGLKSGKIISCALDVFENEPTIDQELVSREDVFLTPHIGSSTIETYQKTAIFCLNNIRACFERKPILSQQN
ncbi:uncharacterized protein ASCRUDRAFT_74004 [Ascoidea rubescens DSM 1968]|uniref:D-isomer specific 2-hydroxyacid dehydrogenase NAD-binding domain-containing protein n=1 Tax=Ascoidea rubescens DSM 1968 TaxID=1344418 RepID=A0A1D2VRW2_9ASCO|nr:hypothetical protein ASCRUDRAFT_74004 [Ascoidea rubescens DSM 1968]ODV64362.1 hypothetical protein ASCRUDRAFT_74004 [Ascoidea rubescens DSM 1968]